jgi:UV DNA damage endonuclease
MPPKRKRSAVASTPSTADSPALATGIPQIRKTEVPLPPNVSKLARRQSSRGGKAENTDPNVNSEILDGAAALRASPDGHEDAPVTYTTKDRRNKAVAQQVKVEEEEDVHTKISNGVVDNTTGPAAADAGIPGDPEDADGAEAEEGDEAEVKAALSRPPPVNSAYLPLPWKGRLGYVCILQTLSNTN